MIKHNPITAKTVNQTIRLSHPAPESEDDVGDVEDVEDTFAFLADDLSITDEARDALLIYDFFGLPHALFKHQIGRRLGVFLVPCVEFVRQTE